MDASLKIAQRIVALTDSYERGLLKRSARDMISGLVIAYGIVIDEPNVEVALERARREVTESCPT